MDTKTQAKTLFVALGLVPMACICLLGMQRMLPSHVTSWEHTLSARLGMDVQIERVEHPRPGQLRFCNVSLVDHPSGRAIAKMLAIDVSTTDDTQYVTLHGTELAAGELTRIWALCQWQLAVWTPDQPAVRIESAEPFRVVQPRGQGTEVSVDIRCEMLESGPHCVGRLNWPGTDAKTAFEVSRAPADGDAPAATRFVVDTDGTVIPLAWLQDAIQLCRGLGETARFSGKLMGQVQGDHHQCTAEGDFLSVDLAQATAALSHVTMQGEAALSVSPLVLQDGQVVRAMGQLRGGSGLIQQAFYFAIGRQLHVLCKTDPPAELPEQLPYQELAIDFAISAEGVSIKGACEGTEHSGIMLADSDAGLGELWGQPREQWQPVAALVSALAPETSERIPLSKPARRLADWLPLDDTPAD